MDHSDDIFFQNWKREQNKIDNISLVIQSASFKLVDSDVFDCFMKQ